VVVRWRLSKTANFTEPVAAASSDFARPANDGAYRTFALENVLAVFRKSRSATTPRGRQGCNAQVHKRRCCEAARRPDIRKGIPNELMRTRVVELEHGEVRWSLLLPQTKSCAFASMMTSDVVHPPQLVNERR
jgi:hypothetical protein